MPLVLPETPGHQSFRKHTRFQKVFYSRFRHVYVWWGPQKNTFGALTFSWLQNQLTNERPRFQNGALPLVNRIPRFGQKWVLILYKRLIPLLHKTPIIDITARQIMQSIKPMSVCIGVQLLLQVTICIVFLTDGPCHFQILSHIGFH